MIVTHNAQPGTTVITLDQTETLQVASDKGWAELSEALSEQMRGIVSTQVTTEPAVPLPRRQLHQNGRRVAWTRGGTTYYGTVQAYNPLKGRYRVLQANGEMVTLTANRLVANTKPWNRLQQPGRPCGQT